MPSKIRFTRIFSMADQLAAQLQGLHFAGPCLQPALGWQPPVNVYAYDDRIDVCIELAGTRKQDIKVDVEPHRLVIRGRRQMPERKCDNPPCGRVLVMEIPDGDFERVIEFPATVDTARVQAKQEDGWLWVTMPILEIGSGA